MTGRSDVARRTSVGYALGSVGTGGWGTLPGLVLLYFLTDTLGVAAILAGVLVTLAKVWDVLIDPVIGARSDEDLARTGSRRRFLLLGAVALPVLLVAMFAVPAGLTGAAAGGWVVTFFVLAATAFSIFQVPYIALPAELTDGYDARTRLVSLRVVVLTIAILVFGGVLPELRTAVTDERLGYLLLAGAAALLLGAGMTIAGLSAPRGPRTAAPRRRVLEDYRDAWAALRRSPPFRILLAAFMLQGLATGLMLAGAQYVATWLLGDQRAVTLLFVALIAPALLFAPLWAAASRRVGKERAFLAASAVFGVAAFALVPLAAAPGAWVYLPVGLAGAAYAGLQSLPLSMLPDVITVDARETGVDRAGVFSGVWTAGETLGMALGATLLTVVLALTGYRESVGQAALAQPDTALFGIALSFSAVPAILVGISIVVFDRYPLRKADLEGER